MVLPPHFLRIDVEVKASGPPHVLRLQLWVCKGMLPVEYFRSTKPLFVPVDCNGDHNTATKMRQNLANISVGDITGFNTVASVCLSVQWLERKQFNVRQKRLTFRHFVLISKTVA